MDSDGDKNVRETVLYTSEKIHMKARGSTENCFKCDQPVHMSYESKQYTMCYECREWGQKANNCLVTKKQDSKMPRTSGRHEQLRGEETFEEVKPRLSKKKLGLSRRWE
jgi:hypothetical protein